MCNCVPKDSILFVVRKAAHLGAVSGAGAGAANTCASHRIACILSGPGRRKRKQSFLEALDFSDARSYEDAKLLSEVRTLRMLVHSIMQGMHTSTCGSYMLRLFNSSAISDLERRVTQAKYGKRENGRMSKEQCVLFHHAMRNQNGSVRVCLAHA